jgi:glycosyltransferase involved in cell wall biosynthesis
LHALINACDIVLSLRHSEGFGLVLAEAMLLGKPAITTGWSGDMTFMDPTSAALVGYRLVPANDPRHVYEGASWAEPAEAEAVAHLRHLADDPSARLALGTRARQTAMTRLGVGPLASALHDMARRFDRQKRTGRSMKPPNSAYFSGKLSNASLTIFASAPPAGSASMSLVQ